MPDITLSGENRSSPILPSSLSLSPTSPTQTPVDSISLSQSVASSTEKIPRADTPLLPHPRPKEELTFGRYAEHLISHRYQLASQLSASAEVDLKFFHQRSDRAFEEARLLDSMHQNIEALYEKWSQQVAGLADLFNKKAQEIDREWESLKQKIDTANQKSHTEQEIAQHLQRARDHYLSALKKMGATDLGNGSYHIPPSARETYAKEEALYKQAVTDYMRVLSHRKEELEQVNRAICSYNQLCNELEELVSQAHLPSSPFPLPKRANERDLSPFSSTIEVTRKTGEYTILVPRIPDALIEIAQKGTSLIPSIERYPKPDLNAIKTEILGELKQHFLADLRIQLKMQDQARTRESEIKKEVLDSYLNLSPLAFKLLPESWFYTQAQQERLLAVGQFTPLSSFSNQFAEAHRQADKREAEIEEREVKAKEIASLNRQIEVLRDLLTQEAIARALAPALILLSPILRTLHPQDPALCLLAASSYLNRVLEDLQHGVLRHGIDKLIDLHFPGDACTVDTRNAYQASAALKPLLLGTWATLQALGLPQLFNDLLLLAEPSLLSDLLPPHLKEEDAQSVFNHVSQHYCAQGYGQAESDALAQMALLLAQRGVLIPSLVIADSTSDYDHSLGERSLQAALILEGKPAAEATSIAHSVFRQMEMNPPARTPHQLTLHLAYLLRQQGIEEHSLQIAEHTLFTPSLLPSHSPFSQEAIHSCIKTRARSLLTAFGSSADPIAAEIASSFTIDPTVTRPTALSLLSNVLPFLASHPSFRSHLVSQLNEMAAHPAALIPLALPLFKPLSLFVSASFPPDDAQRLPSLSTI